jgi:hypothetical protein
MERYDFGASPELLLKPAMPTRGVFGKKGESASAKGDKDKDEEEDEDLMYYDPVIRIKDPSLFKKITAPRKGTHSEKPQH